MSTFNTNLERPKSNPFEGGQRFGATAYINRDDVSILLNWWSANRNLPQCRFSGPVESALEAGQATRQTLLELERARTEHLNSTLQAHKLEVEEHRAWRDRNPLKPSDKYESYSKLD